ncbi:MAG TPA: hypothetical protein VHE35_33660 [Kofleriaceae bacterium]|nr:hypothetical protein [Kofleriaceae bacterium]
MRHQQLAARFALEVMHAGAGRAAETLAREGRLAAKVRSGATGKVSLSGTASLGIDNGGGHFSIHATASVPGCVLGVCASHSLDLGTVAIDRSGQITVDNPFDSDHPIVIPLHL